jgi:DNA invertase Pin-like site-specific DNA recombinase
LRAGHPDVEGLCLALADWSGELRIIEKEMGTHSARSAGELEHLGIGFVSLTEALDLTTPAGPLQSDEIRRLFRAGISKCDIARRLQIGRTSVRRILSSSR